MIRKKAKDQVPNLSEEIHRKMLQTTTQPLQAQELQEEELLVEQLLHPLAQGLLEEVKQRPNPQPKFFNNSHQTVTL